MELNNLNSPIKNYVIASLPLFDAVLESKNIYKYTYRDEIVTGPYTESFNVLDFEKYVASLFLIILRDDENIKNYFNYFGINYELLFKTLKISSTTIEKITYKNIDKFIHNITSNFVYYFFDNIVIENASVDKLLYNLLYSRFFYNEKTKYPELSFGINYLFSTIYQKDVLSAEDNIALKNLYDYYKKKPKYPSILYAPLPNEEEIPNIPNYDYGKVLYFKSK